MADQAAAASGPRRWRWPHLGLSGKLLVLTTAIVMIAEVFIYVPLIANFRINWLTDRLAAAHTAALVLEAAPSGMVPESLTRQLLDSVGARAVAMKMGQTRRLLAVSELPVVLHQEVDIRTISHWESIMQAFMTLFLCDDSDLMRAVGPAPMGGDFVEIVIQEGPLRQAMFAFSRNLLLISLALSAFSAALIYLALHYMFVRPLVQLTTNMTAFRQDPENPARIVTPSQQQDEIGTATRELAVMQRDIASMLQQKNHLAALGLAVSKINHDLRNLLASAQLFSDRISSLPDPMVQRFSPKLMRALERAIAFAESTLSYGRAQEPPPDRHMIPLEPLVEEVRETLGIEADGPIRWISAVQRGLMVDADHDQLFRSLLNLVRNAVQALDGGAAVTRRDPGRDQVRITGRREGAVVVIEVADTGPGLPEKSRAHLFEAFHSSTRGGSGLGLTIAAELIRAHGGSIRLADGTIGASFHIEIPDRAVEIATRRGERARA